MLRQTRLVALGALVSSLSLVLTACGGTQPAGDSGEKVLNLWHYEDADSAMGVAWDKAISLFEAKHPGATVKFERKSFEQIRQSAGMILNSDDVPDLLEYNKGNATAGALSKQGLLTDLTPEVTRRKWDKLLNSGLQTTARYDGDGVMGGDKWYGVPNYAEYVMVYYNKDAFAKYGVAVPKTLDEFQSVLDAFVKAGVTPLSVGGAEYPAQQILYELLLSKATRSFVEDFELYKHKVDFQGPEFTFAARTFAEWVQKGYIAKDSAAVKAEEMGIAFEQGKFPIVITGSWWYGRFVKDIKDYQWGTFLFPGNQLHPGSSGNIWTVPAKAKDKKLAYDFIDITMQPEIQNLMGNSGGIPVAGQPDKISDPKNQELITNFNTISAANGLAFYPDWPAPGYYDVLGTGVQELITGAKTPDQVLAEIAKPYNDNLATIGR